MRRSELEHIIRAAGAIAGVKEIIILGSQSILGQFPLIGEKDLEFFQAAVNLNLVDKNTLKERLAEAMFEKIDFDRIENLINRGFDE